MTSSHFTPELFDFLRELKQNNSREWFQANRRRYETHLREPMLQFIADFGPRLDGISPHLVADPRPVGGSLFRIHRDTRFSRDKNPYKTWAAAQFRHVMRRDVHTPGLYLHLEPGSVFAGAGLWHPDPDSLRRIRQEIEEHPERWQAAVSDPPFKAHCRLGGESLKRPPQGYAPDHPLIEDLKRKDFVANAPFTEAEACAPDFIDRFETFGRAASPLLRFLAKTLELPF